MCEKKEAKYCPHCGKENHNSAKYCTQCGSLIEGQPQENHNAKSKIVAGLLGLFLGNLGVHNFYLGYSKKGVVQLILTVISLSVPIATTVLMRIVAINIWALIESIQILSGSIDKDANGIPLRK